MSTFLCSLGPNLVISPFSGRTRTANTAFQRANFNNFSIERPYFRSSFGLARFALGQMQVPDLENAELVVGDLFGRVEGFLYTIADAAVNSSGTIDAVSATKKNSDWLSGITNAMEVVLKVLKDGLSTLHIPYSYGFAIILLTVLVKAATFPLSKKQVESAMAMQSLVPQTKAIQEKYAGDQERIQLEIAGLYKLAGINPFAGWLPTLATIPIWIGLYRALSNVANEGLLSEGFFWIPSLSGPTTIAARQTGAGTSWLFPFIDNHPPLGWSDTLAYLSLPLLLVIAQYITVQIMQPAQSTEPNIKSSQALTKLLPLMIGYFALSVPSGLSLYWFTNNILSTLQQVWLRKLGGAKNPIKEFNNGSVETEVMKAVVQRDKLTSEGIRPGERFNRLKEQEAQRKRQREEERREAEEETLAGESQITNSQVTNDKSPLESEDIHHASSVGLNSVASDALSSATNGFATNSTTVNPRLKEKVSEIADDLEDERIHLHLVKNVEKSEDGFHKKDSYEDSNR